MNQLVRDAARWKCGISCPVEEQVIGPYTIKQSIGEGHNGSVKLAMNPTMDKKSAVKIVSKTITRKRKDARKEIRILQNACHTNIIKLDGVHEDLQNIYIFTEYCEEGDLYSYIEKNGPLEECVAKRFALQMVSAVEFCHTNLGLCHHDVKLENFVMNCNFEIKMIDFGFAIEFDPSCAGQQHITAFDSSPAYACPEILLRRPHDETVDIFSLGVCLYYMITGNFPFCNIEKTSYEELVANVQQGELCFPLGISLEFRDLVSKMLAKSNRIPVNEIKLHPWFQC